QLDDAEQRWGQPFVLLRQRVKARDEVVFLYALCVEALPDRAPRAAAAAAAEGHVETAVRFLEQRPHRLRHATTDDAEARRRRALAFDFDGFWHGRLRLCFQNTRRPIGVRSKRNCTRDHARTFQNPQPAHKSVKLWRDAVLETRAPSPADSAAR